MPAVVKLTPAAIGRGGYPSSVCHTCVFVAGIHLNNSQDRFPITNVGNDEEEWIPFPRLRGDKLHGNDGVSLPQTYGLTQFANHQTLSER